MEKKKCCSGCASREEDVRTRTTKLKVFDWLDEMPISSMFSKIVEVQFKNTHKEYFHNVNNIRLMKDDIVAVEGTPGHDIGVVSLTGDLVFEKMRVGGVDTEVANLKKIYRKARPTDVDKWYEAIGREKSTIIRTRKIIEDMKLDMKLSDVEFQGDNTKAIFYYIADKRVDFRQLIRVLADEFSIRIEMKQIGARQEAGLVGGIGPCGRELCCSSWLTNFTSVTTGAARKQELSLNPQKLAGQCGKLKCCLNFELDIYEEARSLLPDTDIVLKTTKGNLKHIKTDVLKQLMWYSNLDERNTGLIELPVEKVVYIQKLNTEGKVAEGVGVLPVSSEDVMSSLYTDGSGEDSLTRFDNTKQSRGSRNRKRNKSKNRRKTGNSHPKKN